MGQVNVNPPSSGDGGTAAAGMSMGMMLMLLIGVIVLLLLFWFLLRPLFFGTPANVNVNVRSMDWIDAITLLA